MHSHPDQPLSEPALWIALLALLAALSALLAVASPADGRTLRSPVTSVRY